MRISDWSSDVCSSDLLSALDHRLPTEAGERHQQVVDATGFVVAGRAVVCGAIDEFLMLGADAPAVPGLFALDHGRRALVAVFDDGILAVGGGARAHIARSEEGRGGKDCVQPGRRRWS